MHLMSPRAQRRYPPGGAESFGGMNLCQNNGNQIRSTDGYAAGMSQRAITTFKKEDQNATTN